MKQNYSSIVFIALQRLEQGQGIISITNIVCDRKKRQDHLILIFTVDYVFGISVRVSVYTFSNPTFCAYPTVTFKKIKIMNIILTYFPFGSLNPSNQFELLVYVVPNRVGRINKLILE